MTAARLQHPKTTENTKNSTHTAAGNRQRKPASHQVRLDRTAVHLQTPNSRTGRHRSTETAATKAKDPKLS